MSAKIIDGKALSARTREELKEKTAAFELKYGRKVCLAVVLVGNDPASEVYVRNKIRGCEATNIKSLSYRLPEETTQKEAEELVRALAEDGGVDGILVQLPLPAGLDEIRLLELIPPEKDVDGFHPVNVGNLLLGRETVASCTPMGVMTMLHDENIEICGKHAVIVGRSNIVGKPMAALLLRESATVTICHSKTKNLKDICKQADILVAAIGKAEFITADMVKEGAVVIDVGINRVDGKLKGDVDFENVKEKASYITPVPGGVGPMTITTLLENTCLCAERRENAKNR